MNILIKIMLQKNAGITIISLIIAIIIIIIIASISINALIGNNGILTQAKNAVETTKLAQIKEELQLMFAEYNMDNKENNILPFLKSKIENGSIDEYNLYPSLDDISTMIVIKKDGYYFLIEESNGWYDATLLGTDLDNIGEGYTIVTADSFDKSDGNLSVSAGEGQATLVFYDEIDGELNFDIVSGTVTIYITQDMNLTNENMSRSAIDIHSGATLNLYITDNCTLNVDSGYGEEGETANALGAEGGPGGYAGIHVPDGATLNLYGDGTLIAYGGDAGDGGGAVSGNTGGGRRTDGAGAGIGGNGRKSEEQQILRLYKVLNM